MRPDPISDRYLRHTLEDAVIVVERCPQCRTTRLPREVVCGYCHFDIRAMATHPFDDLLLLALGHPEPDTVMRAIFTLGVRRVARAAEALTARYAVADNPFIQREVVTALDRIGGPLADRVLEAATHDIAVVVRAEGLRLAMAREGELGTWARVTALADASAHVRWMVERVSHGDS